MCSPNDIVAKRHACVDERAAICITDYDIRSLISRVCKKREDLKRAMQKTVCFCVLLTIQSMRNIELNISLPPPLSNTRHDRAE